MALHLQFRKEETRSAFEFLNKPAINFYSGKIQFDDPDYASVIKAFLLQAINHVERTIKGRFNRDLFLKGINDNNKILNEMFPTGCQILKGQDIGETLCSLRNLNAHARLSDHDLSFFENKKFIAGLCNLPKMNDSLRMALKGGTLTMAGFITLILLFLRKESLELIAKRSKVLRIIVSGTANSYDSTRFVEAISHTNLEIPIREKHGDTIVSSIFGEYEDKLSKEGSLFKLEFGTKKNPIYCAIVEIDENKQIISVKKGSLTKTYYPNDYELVVKDRDAFIEASNMFPVFGLVDLLYEMNVSIFDSKIRDEIASKISLYGKLNYTKFYVDKNIRILLLPPTNSDYRIVSSLLTGGLIDFFLKLEEDIYNTYGFEQNGYSKISEALSLVEFSEKLANKLIVLRNFAMHGYVFNEYQINNGVATQYSFDFVINTISDALYELKKKNNELLEKAQENVHIHLVVPLLNGKYSKIVEYTLDAFDGFVKFDPNNQSVKNKALYVISSFFNTEDLNKLYVAYEPKPLIDEYHIEGEKDTRYLYSTSKDSDDRLHDFLDSKECSYSETKTEEKGVLRIRYFEKE